MTSQRLLITGAGGFVGQRLVRFLRQQASWSSAELQLWDAHVNEGDTIKVDLCQASLVDRAIADFLPTAVVHLAAQSHVPTAWQQPELTWQVNCFGTLSLLEALRRHAPTAGVLFVGTAEVYGASFKTAVPLDESASLQPLNPYAASKAAADLMAGQYAAGGLRIVRLRPFNHIGPGQREDFVASSFAAQIARIECGLQPGVIRVGNLQAQRDFLDVADVVRAYALALERLDRLPAGLVLNLCSGVPRRIAEILELLCRQTRCPIRIETDPDRLRPVDIPLAYGRCDAAQHWLGWEPQIPFTHTLSLLLDDWRDRVQRDGRSGSVS